MINVLLFAKKKPNDRHWYAYDVVLGNDTIVFDFRDPEHDIARTLLARGVRGWSRSETGSVNVEAAAKVGVGSNLDRYAWKPSYIGKDSPPAGEIAREAA
jgi:hypothetical protein